MDRPSARTVIWGARNRIGYVLEHPFDLSHD
jgi:hypothetical protein